MTHDVMYRLASIQPMPRGERLAQYDVRCGPIHNAEPLWERMAWGSRWVSGVIGRADHVRRAAAPLRKAREERQYAWACANVLNREVGRLRIELDAVKR